MDTLTIEGNLLYLPKHLLRRFSGKKIELIETEEGILLKPELDVIKEARGILKGSPFNSKAFFAQKKDEKGLEK